MALGPGPCRSGLIALPGPCLPRRSQTRRCILGRVQADKQPGEGVFVAVDVHYLPCGVTLLIVDGYADLNPGGRPGLGAHAHAECGVPVIGIAKAAFRATTQILDLDVRAGHRAGRSCRCRGAADCYYRLTEASPCENGGGIRSWCA